MKESTLNFLHLRKEICKKKKNSRDKNKCVKIHHTLRKDTKIQIKD